MSSLATTVEAWQFKAIAKAHIPDTDALALLRIVQHGRRRRLAACSRWCLPAGCCAAGVGVALFIVPVALTLSSIGVLVFGTLMAAAALKASDQVLRYSIDKATVELLYLRCRRARRSA